MSADRSSPPTPVDVLNAALRKEQAAYRFYDTAYKEARVAEVRELLEKLRDEEARHVRLVTKLLERIALA
jgi:rubrerythrin